MLELSERTVEAYLGLEAGDFRDSRFYLCANNLHADEIWLVETDSEAAALAVLEEARRRMEVKARSYNQYLPEESELARRGVTAAAGRYAALFISPDAEAMREVFLSALGQTAAP